MFGVEDQFVNAEVVLAGVVNFGIVECWYGVH